MKSITVLLVGQIRSRHVLLHSVENLAVAKHRGLVNQVVLATWSSEIPKIRDLLPRLDAAGVLVKWVDEPIAHVMTPGNVMHQMRGVDLALEGVEDTAWVLRARPDFWVDCDMLASLAAADMSIEEPRAGAPTHKIWTPFAELCQPMCLSDIVFFGQYTDIARLQNFDSFPEVAGTNLATPQGGPPITSYDAEVRRFTPAFHAVYPVLHEYYRLSNRFFLGIHELRRAMLAMLYGEDLYWQYMAVYFDILKRYLLIGRDIVKGRILLVRPESFDQTEGLNSVDFSQCGYIRQVLEREPDAVATRALFADAPIYCNGRDDVAAVQRHLLRIGMPLERGLDEALAYRKDAARIAALQAFRERLRLALDGGLERGRAKAFAWQYPFAAHLIESRAPGVA